MGHGVCSGAPQYVCACSDGWTGAACSERLCPVAKAWFGAPSGDYNAHDLTECANVRAAPRCGPKRRRLLGGVVGPGAEYGGEGAHTHRWPSLVRTQHALHHPTSADTPYHVHHAACPHSDRLVVMTWSSANRLSTGPQGARFASEPSIPRPGRSARATVRRASALARRGSRAAPASASSAP